MMGRRGVGMRPRLVGAKGITTSPISHYPTLVFSLSYACFFIILHPKKSYKSKNNLHNSKKSSIFGPQLIHGEYIFI